MYKAQQESGSLGKHVEDYFVADWDPHTVSASVNGAWGKRDDHKTSAGPEVCWDHGGQVEPLNLSDMTESEKEVGPPRHDLVVFYVFFLCFFLLPHEN